VSHDDCKASTHPKHGYFYSSKDNDGRRIHRPDKSDTVFTTFSTPTAKRGKRSPELGIAPAEEKMCVPTCIFIPAGELDFLTDSNIKYSCLYARIVL
jgi:hypothetical protein